MRVIGQLVCGPNEKYLEQTLDEFERLCDDALICLNNPTDADRVKAEATGYEWYEDNREWGKEQPDIKTSLLQRIKEDFQPDWIIVLDADETLPTITRESFEELSQGRYAMQFYVVNLWNDERHYKKNAAFWNVRAYKPGESPDTQFLRKALHCGNAPPFFYGPAKATYVPHIMLHRGLMDYADRQRKSQRYAIYDPNARFKGRDYYDMLEYDQSGGSEYDQSAVLRKISEFCKTL